MADNCSTIGGEIVKIDPFLEMEGWYQMKNLLMMLGIALCCLILWANPALSDWKIQAKELGDATAGKAKAGLCVACHGADGNSMNPEWPSLAGQNRRYLFNQLKAFKLGKKPGGRFNAVMYPLVAGLSEQDMHDIAAYYESLTTKVGKTKKQYLALGQRIYRGGNMDTHVSACLACHGPRGYGNAPAGFPRLSGQHAKYVAIQLHNYKNKERLNGPNDIMQNVAQHMSDEEIDAVAHYVQGLH